MNSAVITTVIPTYRRPRLLARAIESVLRQTYSNIAIKVFDNASGDETAAVVRAYMERDRRVSYIRNETNVGAIKNMILGVESVSTDFYSILNDDDFLLPEFYERALLAFQESPEAGFVCAKTITVDLVSKKWQFRNGDWEAGLYKPDAASVAKMFGSHFTQTGVLLRREMRERIGPFERSGDDMLYQVLAAATTPFVVLNYYGAVFLIHPKAFSLTSGLRRGEDSSNYEAFLSTIEQVLSAHMSPDVKTQLLMLVCKTYGASFDSKKVEDFMARPIEHQHEQNAMFLPSTISAASIFSFLYERTSPRFHPLLSQCIRFVRQLRRWMLPLQGERKRDWAMLPREAYAYCQGEEEDPSRFLSSLQIIQKSEVNRPVSR